MRKRTINYFADTIFWYLLYFLPVLGFLLYMLISPGANDSSTTIVSLYSYLNFSGFNVLEGTFIFNTLNSLFGINGVFSLFQSIEIFILLSWFVDCYIVHLAIDFILFIPRLCHKWMKTFTQGE